MHDSACCIMPKTSMLSAVDKLLRTVCAAWCYGGPALHPHCIVINAATQYQASARCCALFSAHLTSWLQVATSTAMDKHPICFRFPRGNGIGVDLAAAGITGFKGTPIEVGLISRSSISCGPIAVRCTPTVQALHGRERTVMVSGLRPALHGPSPKLH